MIDGTHRADPLGDGGQVDLLPHQSVGVPLVDVVSVDLGAAAVFGLLPGHSDGGAVGAQHGDAEGSAGSCWITFNIICLCISNTVLKHILMIIWV